MAIERDLGYYIALRGAPALILLILAEKKRPLSLKRLQMETNYSRKTLLNAMSLLGPDYLKICAVSANKDDEQYIGMPG